VTDRSKGGWFCALLYMAACLVGIFGWAGLVVGVVLGCLALVISAGSKERAARAPKRPTKTLSVAEGQRCPLCHADFEAEEVVETCVGCGTLYHQGCREEWRVCATLGCRKRKRTLRSQGDQFLVSKSGKPRVRAVPKVRRKILIRRDPSSGALRAPRDEPIVLDQPASATPYQAARPSPEQLAAAAQRVLHRRVAS